MADNNQHVTNESSPNHDGQRTLVTPAQNVRRRLVFSTEEVDEDLIQKFQAENQHKERIVAGEKWNFDFENGVPLPGDWQWEKVATVDHVPNSTEVIVGIKDNSKENRNV